MSEPFKYDVFISHSSKDKPIVRELAKRLKQDGLRVWFDEWEIKPGDMIGRRLEEGLEQSRALLLVMSANAFASDWITLERHTAIFRDPTNTQRRFIPLRLDYAPLIDTLRQFAYVDWREQSEEQYALLLAACRPATSETETDLNGEQRAVKIFKEHRARVSCLAVMPDGRQVISGSSDAALLIWDLKYGVGKATLDGDSAFTSVAVTPDGRLAVTGSIDGTVCTWDIARRQQLAVLKGHTWGVLAVALTPDRYRIVSGSADKTIRVWDVMTERCLMTLEGHTGYVNSIAVMPDGEHVVSASEDKTLRVWNLSSGMCLRTLRGHTEEVRGVAVTPDGSRIVSGSSDGSVRVWDTQGGLMTLEGHSEDVLAVAAGAERVVSASRDRSVRVWDLSSGACLATFTGHTGKVTTVALTPDESTVVSGSDDRSVRVWAIPSSRTISDGTRYSNAKVLLVGDSGVGKSSLAMRLVEDRYQPAFSTQDAWATQFKLPSDVSTGNVEREIWLWDLAGEQDYKLIHQLFMDEMALAVLVFDPQNENPFEALGQWDRDLGRATRRQFAKLLVAGRCDRGGFAVNRQSIERFRLERGFTDYMETSAYTGMGCAELREAIIKNIRWDEIPWTASPRIFKLLKEEIIKLRDKGRVLLRMSELRQQLEMRLPSENFTLEQLRAVIALLAAPGVVRQLEFGDFVLLRPEYINSYATAVIQTVRAHPDEIGSIPEEEVLVGNLLYRNMKRLPRDEEQIVLRAMHQTFVNRGLCLREHTESGTLLVFPSYFRRDRPEHAEAMTPYITYRFSGQLDEIYDTLVVRLHNTIMFEKDRLWHFAADFKTQTGKCVSIKLTKKQESAGELSISFEDGIPDDTKLMFIRYVNDHLQARARDVMRVRHYTCARCLSAFEPDQIRAGLELGASHIYCHVCNERLLLFDLIEEQFISDGITRGVREMDELASTRLDDEARELILLGHAFSVAGEAGQIFRPLTSTEDLGIDGEIELKDGQGQPSGRRIYLQFKSSEHYLHALKPDGTEVYTIKNPRHADYWQQLDFPVMLVTRTSDGQIRWMNVSEYLREYLRLHDEKAGQILFEGEPFTALNLVRLHDSLASRGSARASEVSKAGREHLEAGKLDDAVDQFTKFLSLRRPDARDREWRSVRAGLLEVACRSVEDSPGRMNLALATLIKEEPSWVARRLCRGVKLTDASLDHVLDVRLKMGLMPVMLVAAESNGFGWDIQLTPVDASESGGQPLTIPFKVRSIGDNVVQLTADAQDLSWGLYLLTVRFLEGEHVRWLAHISLSRGEFKNPYIAGPPVRRPELFFGRDDLLKDVSSWLGDYSVALLGPRRSGKTSFLYQLARIASPDRVPVLIDLHTFAGASTTKVAAGLRRDIFRACVPDSNERVPADLRGLQRKIQKAGVERLLILLDEMAVLAKHPAVALQLRAISKWQQPQTSIIVAGTISDERKVSAAALDIGSPPFNEFRVCELEEISRRHAQDLLEKPVLGFYRYESAAIEMLLTLGGGQPFFLNILAQLVLKFVQAENEHVIRPAHVEAARMEAVHELGRWFQEFVVELAPATRAALPELVQGHRESLPVVHAEPLRNAGLTVGPRSQLRLSPLFTDWWNSALREEK